MMSKQATIKVVDLIGSPYCISTEDGEKVFDKVVPFLKNGKPVTISFVDATMVVPVFLSFAIGDLYGSFTEGDIQSLVKVEGLSAKDMNLLKIAMANSKAYYADPEGCEAAWLEEMGENY